MADYGLTATGFVPKTLEVLRAELDEAVRAAFGNSIKTSDTSVFGTINGIMADAYASLWELAEAVSASTDPDAATGAALEALCALTGTVRREASASSATLALTGTALTVIPTGSQASVTGTEALFETLADATLQELAVWLASTPYVAGDRRSNAGNAYVCTLAGTSAASGGPDNEDTADLTGELDGTARWRFIGEGTANADVAGAAVVAGPTEAASGDLITIETPVFGWAGVVNLADADVGNAIESDESLRIRREIDLAAVGTSPPDAIRAALLALTGVVSATVFYNNTDATDADGVPPHAVEALVRMPVGASYDQAVFDCLLANVAAGIATHGSTDGTAEDAEGVDQTMSFSRPDEIEIYVDVTLVKDPLLYPVDGDDQVIAAIVAWGDAKPCGYDVRASAMMYVAHTVAGVLEVTDIDIGTSAAPTLSTTIAISTRELAVFDTSRITVASSDGTP